MDSLLSCLKAHHSPITARGIRPIGVLRALDLPPENMEVVNMDSRNCRRNALECKQLSETASSPETKKHFVELSQTWLRLAGEVELGQTLVDLLNEESASQAMSEK
jgi:hypothetical protein